MHQRVFYRSELKEAMAAIRHKVELSEEKGFRYADKTLISWSSGCFFFGGAAGLSMIGVSIYSATMHGIELPGYVFLIAAGTYIATYGIEFVSYFARRNTLAKQAERSEIGEGWWVPLVTESLGPYYVASAVLAAGYIGAQLYLQAVLNSAMTAEFAAITGAIMGAVLAIPSIWVGPARYLQGGLAHGWDIVASALAGAAALYVGHLTAEAFFIHMIGKTASWELSLVFIAGIAMPVYAVGKIFCSSGLEGGMTVAAYMIAGAEKGSVSAVAMQQGPQQQQQEQQPRSQYQPPVQYYVYSGSNPQSTGYSFNPNNFIYHSSTQFVQHQ
ncbi:MAG: hypothetical protein JSS50_04425 [Proteobacteria bacterium]|nr:hypothetical protein [Pseudomonadota bacterium]